MSVSRVVLRIEIANDYPLLPYLHFNARRTLMSESNEFPRKDLKHGKSEKLKEQYQGRREMSDIAVENLTSSEEDGKVCAQSYAQVAESSRKAKLGAPGAEGGKVEGGKVCDSKETSPQAAAEKKSRVTTLQVPYFSGNHFIEVTKGILHLYKENQRTSMEEEAERSEMLCILSVPGAMTSHDLLQFSAAFSENIEQMRIIRNSKPNQYMVLIKFRNQKSADEFYDNFNGIRFNSIEPEICHLVYVASLETVKESEEACMPLYGHTELPTCPVCLERMDESVEGILTILCNHSFHGLCLAKWGDTSCPVCRYSQTPELVPDNHCFACGTQENLWICLICGHVGCGRYEEGHAFKHYLDTQHTYAMQLGNNRVWDYAGDNYVHRLVQNKADGKPVELIRGELENDEKLDSIQLEYTYLLTSQLENQRHFFESEIARIEKDTNSQIEELKELAENSLEGRKRLEKELEEVKKEKNTYERRITTLTAKLNKVSLELKEEKEMNECLRQNQQLWQNKIEEMEKNVKEINEHKDKEINEVREQLRDLMFYLEVQRKMEEIPESDRIDIQGGQVVMPTDTTSASSPSLPSTSTKSRRRKK